MFIVENYALAVGFCLITMLCWGSWANTQKLTNNSWRFELFYWDYVIGIVILSLLLALTMGSMGNEGRPFIEDLKQASTDAIGSALLGGAVFNIANILLIAAMAIAGMSVAFPVGIGIALILGVINNYIKNPVGNPLYLFGGVGLVAFAIILNALAFRKLGTQKDVSVKGLILAVISGCLMGLFYGFVAESMTPDFANPTAGLLTPYTAVFIFAIGVFLSNFILNTILMKVPIEGAPVNYKAYFRGSFKNHSMGVLGGVIWCLGMAFSIIASGAAGTAISYGLGQGATIVAALWGIFIWKEFASAPKGTNKLLYLMLFFYLIGLACIIISRDI